MLSLRAVGGCVDTHLLNTQRLEEPPGGRQELSPASSILISGPGHEPGSANGKADDSPPPDLLKMHILSGSRSQNLCLIELFSICGDIPSAAALRRAGTALVPGNVTNESCQGLGEGEG